MKFIPDAISRKIAEQGLLASENAPKILFVAGVTGMVGSTVLACRATLKLDDVLEGVQEDRQKAHEVKRLVEDPGYTGGSTYTEAELKKDLTIITVRGVVGVAKLYAPAVLLGAASITCLTKSHSIL